MNSTQKQTNNNNNNNHPVTQQTTTSSNVKLNTFDFELDITHTHTK